MVEFHGHLLLLWAFCGALEGGALEVSRGGTKLSNRLFVPPPALVVLSSTINEYEYDEPSVDCVGVFIGGFNRARDQNVALTSPYCRITPYAEVRTAKSEVIHADPVIYGDTNFQIAIIQLALRESNWIPTKANVERDKGQIQKHLKRGTEDSATYGFGLAVNTNPMKAYTVTWNQSGCAGTYKNLRSDSWNWPVELPDSAFCVHPGSTPANITLNNSNFTIAPGTPCDDALGSPVVYSTTSEEPTTVSTTTTETPPPLPRVPNTSKPCMDSSSGASSHLTWLTSTLFYGLLGGWR